MSDQRLREALEAWVEWDDYHEGMYSTANPAVGKLMSQTRTALAQPVEPPAVTDATSDESPLCMSGCTASVLGVTHAELCPNHGKPFLTCRATTAWQGNWNPKNLVAPPTPAPPGADLQAARELALEHERKWRTYEREYILPCFDWATEYGIDLRELVRRNPGKNCVELLVRALAAFRRKAREEALERNAIVWELKPETSKGAGDELRLERRDGFKGRRWAITRRGWVLNKSGEWEYEPQPSSRTEEWLETVRWATAREAALAAGEVKETK